MPSSLYRVSTYVNRHDFDGKVLENFTIEWIVTGRERPPAAYLLAVTDWSPEKFGGGDPALIDAVDAVNQMFTLGQANSLAMFLKNTQGWESRLTEVPLPLPAGARPLVGGDHQIQIPPGAITFLPGQAAYVAGFVGASRGSTPKPATEDAGAAQTEAASTKQPQPSITTGPAQGIPRGLGVSIVGPVGQPKQEDTSGGEAEAGLPGSGRIGLTISQAASSEEIGPAPVAPELRGAAPVAPAAAPPAASAAAPSATAASTGDRCEACERSFGSDTSQLRAIDGHTLCVACLDADRAAALDIARARHRAYLQQLRASLGGAG
jgi:hypothetical protein